MNYYILGRRRRGNLTTKTVFVEKSTGIMIEENERNKVVHEKELVLLSKKERKYGPGAGNRKTGTAQIKKRA